jgi:hypothetical protein
MVATWYNISEKHVLLMIVSVDAVHLKCFVDPFCFHELDI